MKVKELIEKLQEYPEDSEVSLTAPDGFNYDGEITGITEATYSQTLYVCISGLPEDTQQ